MSVVKLVKSVSAKVRNEVESQKLLLRLITNCNTDILGIYTGFFANFTFNYVEGI